MFDTLISDAVLYMSNGFLDIVSKYRLSLTCRRAYRLLCPEIRPIQNIVREHKKERLFRLITRYGSYDILDYAVFVSWNIFLHDNCNLYEFLREYMYHAALNGLKFFKYAEDIVVEKVKIAQYMKTPYCADHCLKKAWECAALESADLEIYRVYRYYRKCSRLGYLGRCNDPQKISAILDYVDNYDPEDYWHIIRMAIRYRNEETIDYMLTKVQSINYQRIFMDLIMAYNGNAYEAFRDKYINKFQCKAKELLGQVNFDIPVQLFFSKTYSQIFRTDLKDIHIAYILLNVNTDDLFEFIKKILRREHSYSDPFDYNAIHTFLSRCPPPLLSKYHIHNGASRKPLIVRILTKCI